MEQGINLHIKDITKLNETYYEIPRTSGKSSRRKLSFEDSSERSKRRKSNELRKPVGFPELTRAAKMSLRSDGKTDAAEVFSEALKTNQARRLRIRKA